MISHQIKNFSHKLHVPLNLKISHFFFVQLIDTRTDDARHLQIFKLAQILPTIEAIQQNEPPVTRVHFELADELDKKAKPPVIQLMKVLQKSFGGEVAIHFNNSFRRQASCDEFILQLRKSK